MRLHIYEYHVKFNYSPGASPSAAAKRKRGDQILPSVSVLQADFLWQQVGQEIALNTSVNCFIPLKKIFF